MVSDALAISGLLAFTTFDPEHPEVCVFGGNGKIYTLLATNANAIAGATRARASIEGFAGEPVVTPSGFTTRTATARPSIPSRRRDTGRPRQLDGSVPGRLPLRQLQPEHLEQLVEPRGGAAGADPGLHRQEELDGALLRAEYQSRAVDRGPRLARSLPSVTSCMTVSLRRRGERLGSGSAGQPSHGSRQARRLPIGVCSRVCDGFSSFRPMRTKGRSRGNLEPAGLSTAVRDCDAAEPSPHRASPALPRLHADGDDGGHGHPPHPRRLRIFRPSNSCSTAPSSRGPRARSASTWARAASPPCAWAGTWWSGRCSPKSG